MNSQRKLDTVDLTLLNALQERGRTKRGELAEMTGLSIPSVSERLKKLEEEGVIRSYGAVVDPQRLGLDVAAFIFVTIDSSRHYGIFLEKVSSEERIVECHAITGEGTHLLKVRTKNTKGLEELLSLLQSWPGVTKTTTRVVLSSPKETTRLPMKNGI